MIEPCDAIMMALAFNCTLASLVVSGLCGVLIWDWWKGRW